MIYLCLGLLTIAVTVSASLDPNGKDSVAKYTLKLSKDGKEYDGEVDIDTKKGTEIFHVSKGPSDEEAGDVVYDFKNGKTMIRLPDSKSCFLSNSTDYVPKPADLIQLLEKSNLNGVALKRSENAINSTVVGTLEDRSELSAEMAGLCAGLPIYIVAEGDVNPSDVDQTPGEAEDEIQTSYDEQLPAGREKRFWGGRRRRRFIRIRVPRIRIPPVRPPPILRRVCKTACSYTCHRHCNIVCHNVCKNECNRRICKLVG